MIQAVVYQSNTGFTKKYAELFAKETGLACYALSEALNALEKDAPVLFMGWIFARKIQGMEKARRKFDVRAAAAVGMTPPQDKMVPELKEDNNLHELPLFYLQGGAAPERLRGLKKLIFQMAVKLTKKAASANGEKDRAAEETLRVMETGGDFVSMENLKELLAWLKEEQAEGGKG